VQDSKRRDAPPIRAAGADDPEIDTGDYRFESWPYVDRRLATDRREQPTGFWDSLISRGSRRAGRRRGERDNIYVDVYGGRDVALVLGVLFLNILDAWLTLDYTAKGGAEANPVANRLLELGNDYFVYAKCVLVGLCLTFLLVHKTFRYVRLAIRFMLLFYGALLVYHLFLQANFYVHQG